MAEVDGRPAPPGFSSSHAPTQLDGDGRPDPQPLRRPRRARARSWPRPAAHRGGSVSYLPASSIGGLDHDDKELLVELGVGSRLPIVIQGLGGRNKVDAPTAGWAEAEAFLGDAAGRGAAIFSLLRNHPFDRPSRSRAAPSSTTACPPGPRSCSSRTTRSWPACAIPACRDELRDAVDHPNKDAAKGSTLPPPHWHVVFVDEVAKPEHEKYLKRSINDIAAELGKAPADAMLDLALDEDLRTSVPLGEQDARVGGGGRESQRHPSMIVGRVRRRRAPGSRRRLRLVELLPALLGVRPPGCGRSRRASGR